MAYARIGYTYAVTWDRADEGKPYLEAAFKYSNRITEKDRLYISAWYSIANYDFEGAIGFYRQIIAIAPSDIEAYHRLSRLLRGEKRYDEAMNILRAGLAVDPDARILYNGLGGILSSRGRYAEAIAAHQQFVALAPGEPNAYDSLGLSYQGSGNYQAAIDNYQKALELDPKFIIATIHLANSYFQTGQYQKALDRAHQYFRDAVTDGERARAYSTLAWIYLKKGDLLAAKRAAAAVERFDRRSSLRSTIIAIESGDMARARSIDERFFEQFPPVGRGTKASARPELYFRGYFKFKAGATSEALDYFRQALTEEAGGWDIDVFEDCLAEAYAKLGRFDEAAAEYERILGLNPNYPLAAFNYAKVLDQLGRQTEAVEYYRRFLESWKDADRDVRQVIEARRRVSDAT